MSLLTFLWQSWGLSGNYPYILFAGWKKILAKHFRWWFMPYWCSWLKLKVLCRCSNLINYFTNGKLSAFLFWNFRQTLWLQKIAIMILNHTAFLHSWFIVMKVARDWCIYASARILVGSQRFISGLICPSTPFARHRRFTSPFKRAADSQNFWRLSNTGALVYVHRPAIFPALHWRSSEREKKLSNRLAASSFFQNFRAADLTSIIWSVRYLDWSVIEHAHSMVDSTFPRTCALQCLQTRNSLGKRTGSPVLVRPNELRRTRKTFGASKMRTLFQSVDLLDPRQSTRSSFHLEKILIISKFKFLLCFMSRS